MTDSLGLAKTIIVAKHRLNQPEAISLAIEHYEQEMFPRAEMFAKKTYAGLEHHFRATGAQEWAERFTQKKENSA